MLGWVLLILVWVPSIALHDAGTYGVWRLLMLKGWCKSMPPWENGSHRQQLKQVTKDRGEHPIHSPIHMQDPLSWRDVLLTMGCETSQVFIPMMQSHDEASFESHSQCPNAASGLQDLRMSGW